MKWWLAVPGALALANTYLLALAAAAALPRRRTETGAGSAAPRFALLIPAHNEESGLGETLAAVQRLDYPAGRWEAIVIADNCTDATAAVAKDAGVTVFERSNPERRGKGFALSWALERLAVERPDVDAVAVLDADCLPSPNMLTAMAARLSAGAAAVQVDYRVANPGASWTAGLRYAAFALINTVRPLGKERLGLSAGLMGTGMAFRRDVLARHPWSAFSVVEDGEYHARLVLAGERTAFAPEATVLSAMPVTLRQARAQQERWEGGKVELIRRCALPLLRAGVARRDPAAINAAAELLVPPQSLLFALNGGAALLALASRSRAAAVLAAAAISAQGAYVAGGLALTRAPASVYQALAMAPVLVLWKLALYGRVLAGRTSQSWVRTGREAEDRLPSTAQKETAHAPA